MSESRDGFRPIETAREIVIYRGGWGFVLPEQDSVAIDRRLLHVELSAPDRGGTYQLDWLDDSDPEELRVYVVAGEPLSGHAVGDLAPVYPFTTIRQELDRLRNRWEAAGGPLWESSLLRDRTRAKFEASALSYDEQTSRMRQLVRGLERGDELTSM
jgi:hypothetical protein